MIEIGLKANLWLAQCVGLIIIERESNVSIVLYAAQSNVQDIVCAVKRAFKKPTTINKLSAKPLYGFRHLRVIET